jgi:hypothetical protein
MHVSAVIEGSPMTSSMITDTPKCPDCRASMRLTRVLPSVLPKDCAPETCVLCARAAERSRARFDRLRSLAALAVTPVTLAGVSHTYEIDCRALQFGKLKSASFW